MHAIGSVILTIFIQKYRKKWCQKIYDEALSFNLYFSNKMLSETYFPIAKF